MIEIAGVRRSFGGRPVLRGVDLEIRDGETMVIIGGSGSGKSTLLKCIVGLVRPDGGSIEVDGVDIAKLKDERAIAEYRRKFGYMFQEGALFDSLPVWCNVAFGLPYLTDLPEDRYRQVAGEKLALVGLKGVEDQAPSQLSGGMKRRVALARAIAAEPRYLLYDEPTAGLDPITADVVCRLMSELKSRLGVTSVIVTHDLTSAYKTADRIAMLFEGRIRAVAPPAAIRDSKDPFVSQFIHGLSEGPIKVA